MRKTQEIVSTRSNPKRARLGRAREQAGQALVLLAFMMIVLLGGVGLAVDSGLGYFFYQGAGRAANAAALAAVIDMPYDLTGATARAVRLAALNGFDCSGDLTADGCAGPPPESITVHVSPVTGQPNQVRVVVGRTVPIAFMQIFGIVPYPVKQTGVATYLPPISLGQQGNETGADAKTLGSANHPTINVMEGWNVNREQGDAFTPNPCCDPTGVLDPSTDYHLISPAPYGNNEYVDDSLPTRGGYNFAISLKAPGQIEVYNAVHGPDGENLQPYNFCNNHEGIPSGLYCNPNAGLPDSKYNLHENYFMKFNPARPPMGGFESGYADAVASGDAKNYVTMQYTIFQVNSVFDHALDLPVSQIIVRPIDATNWGQGGTTPVYKSMWPAYFNQDITQTYDLMGKPVNMTAYHAWMSVNNPPVGTEPTVAVNAFGTVPTLPAGNYRLRVDMLRNDGSAFAEDGTDPKTVKAFSVRCVDPSGICTASAQTDEAIFTPFAAGAGGCFAFNIFQLPPAYAGQVIRVDVFDPGDVAVPGLTYMGVLAPYDTVSTDPCTTDPVTGVQSISDEGVIRDQPNTDSVCGPITVPCGAGQLAEALTTSGAVRPFNGHWLRFELKIPSTYCQGVGYCDPLQPNTWWWNFRYKTSGGAEANDVFTLMVYLKGNGLPVHLLPPS